MAMEHIDGGFPCIFPDPMPIMAIPHNTTGRELFLRFGFKSVIDISVCHYTFKKPPPPAACREMTIAGIEPREMATVWSGLGKSISSHPHSSQPSFAETFPKTL
uniref:Uncharacterized protein n=1 Tax=Sphaerodactylus townsendi TaxID=933632 RepID=A0ACB8EJM3_9SAUR